MPESPVIMAPKRRILFFSHYFPPEGNAPATRVHEMARQWVADGYDVTVITGVPNVPNGIIYPGYRNRLIQREKVDGIEVLRVITYVAPNKGTVRRTLNYLSYMMAAAIAGLFVRRPDVVIATSPQFFCGWAGMLVARFRRLPFILEVRDLWPDSIEAVEAIRSPRIIGFLLRMERHLYRSARHIVTVGDGYKEQLLAKNVPAHKLSVIPNGINGEDYKPRPSSEHLRSQYGLTREFICAYVGTVGMAAGLEVVLGAARRFKEKGVDAVRFMVIGDGAERERLQLRAERDGLNNVIFTGRQDKRAIPDYLASVDACLVHLKKSDLFRTVLPSKIFEAAGMERPIIMGVEGYAAELVRSANAGICIEPENDEELCAAIEFLMSRPDIARQYGESGRAYVLRHFDRTVLSRRYERLIDSL